MKNQCFPQVIKRILPAMGNEIITLVKDTSLAFAIGVAEMFSTAKALVASQVSMLPFVFAAVFYWVFNFIVEVVLNRIEKKPDYYHDSKLRRSANGALLDAARQSDGILPSCWRPLGRSSWRLDMPFRNVQDRAHIEAGKGMWRSRAGMRGTKLRFFLSWFYFKNCKAKCDA